MPEMSKDEKRNSVRQKIAGGVLAGQAAFVDQAGERMLRTAPRLGRIVAKGIPGAPGLVFDLANYATAKDKGRARAELIGQVAGGALGSWGGPVGVAVGSTAGAFAGEYLYDHKDDIQGWMDRRWNDLARAAGERVLPYTPTPRMNRALGR